MCEFPSFLDYTHQVTYVPFTMICQERVSVGSQVSQHLQTHLSTFSDIFVQTLTSTLEVSHTIHTSFKFTMKK